MEGRQLLSVGDVDDGIARLLVAAKKGFDEAMVDLGAAYDVAGLEVDKGVSLRSAESVFSVGKRFEDGDGVQKNAEKAVEWYTRAAKMDDAKAIAALGFCYNVGVGVEKNVEKAVELHMRAAALGDSRAMNNLAVC